MSTKGDDHIEIDERYFEPFDCSKLGLVQYILAFNRVGEHVLFTPENRVDVEHNKRGLTQILNSIEDLIRQIRQPYPETEVKSPPRLGTKKQVMSLQFSGDTHVFSFGGTKPGGDDIPCDEDELTLRNLRTLK